jgi:uncharacterized OB-fold protein
MSERPICELTPGPDDEPWFAATARGVLMLRHCDACGEVHFPPRPICPHCFSDRTGFREATGGGTIYSFSILRRVAVPYCIAYVTLDEGPTMLSNIVDCPLDRIAIGQRVRVVFADSVNGLKVPMFAPG